MYIRLREGNTSEDIGIKLNLGNLSIIGAGDGRMDHPLREVVFQILGCPNSNEFWRNFQLDLARRF